MIHRFADTSITPSANKLMGAVSNWCAKNPVNRIGLSYLSSIHICILYQPILRFNTTRLLEIQEHHVTMSSGNRDKYVNDSTLCLRILVFKRVYNRFRLFLTSPKVTGPGELSDQNRMSAWSRFHFCKIHQNPWSSTQVKPKKWTILNDILPCFLPTSPTSLAFRWIQSIIVLSVAIWRHIPSC